MEPLEPRKGGSRDNPCLAAVKKNGLDDSLVEPCGHERRGILAPEDLTNPCPSSMGFPNLRPNCLDVVVVLSHELPEVFLDFNTLEYIPANGELLAEGQS